MNSTTILALLLPLTLLIVVVGVVAVVALFRAKRKDVPRVMKTFGKSAGKLAKRTPRVSGGAGKVVPDTAQTGGPEAKEGQ